MMFLPNLYLQLNCTSSLMVYHFQELLYCISRDLYRSKSPSQFPFHTIHVLACNMTHTHAGTHTHILNPPQCATTCKRSPLRAVERYWAPLEPSGYNAPSSTPRGLGPTKPGPVLTHTTVDARSTSSKACRNFR